MDHYRNIIHQLAEDFSPEIIVVRRHFHRNPELSNEEFQTAELICAKLDEYGIPYRKGVAGNGIVGHIMGKNAPSKCIALRADMDALPIKEMSNVPYRSEVPGKMHACGHDVHMACLLGAAKILTRMKDRFEGTVKLIFQPSEETYPGGAVRMIGEGALEDPCPSYVIGQHVINTLEAGEAGFKAGPYMASTDEFYITVKGRGGHAATPHQVTDPILVASHIVVALQQIVSRNADPTTPTVVSVGKFIGEGRTNVIPGEVKMEGTVRTYDEFWRKEIHRRIGEIASSVANGMGATCEVRIAHGYPFLNNDPGLSGILHDLAVQYLGKERVRTLEKRMTAEDFAYFALERPSCLYRLGIANESKGITSNLHSDTFDVDESSIGTGMGLMAWLAVGLLQPEKQEGVTP